MAIVFVWNPSVFPFAELTELRDTVRRGKRAAFHWAVGKCRDAEIGETIYLWRRLPTPEGVVASGRISGEPFAGEHFAGGTRRVMYYPIEFEVLINGASDFALDAQTLAGELGPYWGELVNGMRVPDEDAPVLAEMWETHVKGSRGVVVVPGTFATMSD